MVANFEKFLILPGFILNFGKCYQISKNYLKCSESHGQKPLGVLKDPLGLNRVNSSTLTLNRPCPFPSFPQITSKIVQLAIVLPQ